MNAFELYPEGPLFFRDARPLDQDKTQEEHRNIGHGAYWPRPDHLYNAVMHALIDSRECPESAYGQFGGLQTTGPFPKRDGRIFFPRPLDWTMALEECKDTDLPSFLTHGLIDRKVGKKRLPAFIPYETYKGYLAGKTSGELEEATLYQTEPRIGTTLSPETGASRRIVGKRSGQYHAEYLRLGPDVSMACLIEIGDPTCPSPPSEFILGGQGGIVKAEPSAWSLEKLFPVPRPPSGNGPVTLRWTLLSPAYFSQTGWLPGWCKDTRQNTPDEKRRPDGEVMFPGCEDVRLIAACTGKPLFFSGWNTQTGPKPTILAVPAGSAYYFECPDKQRAEALIAKLHLQRKSDLGSQGFGIGVCSFIPR